MIEFQVNDMSCGHCVNAITQAIAAADPAAQVDIDLPAHRVRITGSDRQEALRAAISEAGYTPELVS